MLFPENRKPIPEFLSGKKNFQKCNPPDFKFYIGKATNKHFPKHIWCNVSFASVFIAINNTKSKENRTKINITLYGGGGGEGLLR